MEIEGRVAQLIRMRLSQCISCAGVAFFQQGFDIIGGRGGRGAGKQQANANNANDTVPEHVRSLFP
jgi:hypothetical protein